MKLEQHINEKHDGNKSAFARANGVIPQQVNTWLRKGFLVINGFLYSKRREVK